MDDFDCYLLELAAKKILLNNDRVWCLVSNMSKFKTLVYDNLLVIRFINTEE